MKLRDAATQTLAACDYRLVCFSVKRIGVKPAWMALVLLTYFAAALDTSAWGQAAYLTGVGPVNRAMGGAGTAAPLDAIGAINWNPASISGLGADEASFGVEFLNAEINLSSTVGPGTDGDAGAVVIPSVGWVHRLEDERTSIGLALFGNAGFKNNQPAGNPVLGGAPAFAGADFIQITPTISYVLSDRVSIGFAPNIAIGEVVYDPVGPSIITPLATPGQGNRTHWGLGFQTGIYYIGENDVHLGLMFKSPQWMETFEFFTPTGTVTLDFDLPMILSLGTAYAGIDGWTFAADFRYFGFDDVDGPSELGWSNVFAAAFGAEHQISERFKGRLGVNFNQPVIRPSDVELNVVTPLIQDYNLSLGGSYMLDVGVEINAAYVYLGNNSVTGPVLGGAAEVTHEVYAHSAIMGVTIRY